MTKVQVKKISKALKGLASEEFSEARLRGLEEIFEEVAFGKIIVTVGDGCIESIKISKTYRPVVDNSG